MSCHKINLDKAHLKGTHLEGAILHGIYMYQAYLHGAYLENTDLSWAHLENCVLREANLAGADLRGIFFNSVTDLTKVVLGDKRRGFPLVVDAHWNNTNLSVIDWTTMNMLGDEYITYQRKSYAGEFKNAAIRFEECKEAVRANRQLTVALQEQGLSEDASRFAYRAQKLQRIILRRQRKFGQYLFSGFLDLLAGYGYRPGRSVIWYLATIFVFALAYHFLGGLTLYPPDAFVFSIMSFHGRGFFPALSQETNLHNPLVMLAAA